MRKTLIAAPLLLAATGVAAAESVQQLTQPELQQITACGATCTSIRS